MLLKAPFLSSSPRSPPFSAPVPALPAAAGARVGGGSKGTAAETRDLPRKVLVLLLLLLLLLLLQLLLLVLPLLLMCALLRGWLVDQRLLLM